MGGRKSEEGEGGEEWYFESEADDCVLYAIARYPR